MKNTLKTVLLCCILLACLCGLGWLVWVHRRVIVALVKGEPLPEVPEGCPAYRGDSGE